MIQPVVPVRLSADWVLPIDRPPIRDAAVLIGADGRIAAVGPVASIPSPPGGRDERFAGAALMPGLVNAHTHLELTGLATQVEPTDFPGWIRSVRELKAALGPEWFAAAARQGVRDAFAAGITYVLDTGDSGAVFGALTELGGAGVGYQEVFGPHPSQADASRADLVRRVEAAQASVGARVVVGVSPHAPYTVSGPLYRAVARFAEEGQYPIAVHLAESRAETAFVALGEGPFAAAWSARGIPPLADQRPNDPAARRSPVAWLDAHGVLTQNTLVIHGVQLDAADRGLLAARGVGLAHCPCSNRNHGHGDAPLAAILQAAIRVGVGTDSVVSVGRLDLFSEIRAARVLGGLSAAQALSLGTRDGAKLVAAAPDFGTITAGHWADLVAISLPGDQGTSPEELILAAGPEQVLATYASGRPVYRSGHPA